jgi:hypothetical protein
MAQKIIKKYEIADSFLWGKVWKMPLNQAAQRRSGPLSVEYA